MAEFEDYESSDLDWPDEHSMEEVVTALRNYDGKKADIRLTSLMTLSADLFAVGGTFECVFNAVIDGGTINEFVGQAESFPDLKLGCIGRSNLANNTALEKFSLELWEDDMFVADEGIEQLANALKSNRCLEEIIITRGMMTNAGRIHLLESLRDNTTLLKLDTRAVPMAISPDDDVNEDEVLLKEGGIEGRLLQSRFDQILAKKPLLLYTFIREEDHTQLFGTLYNRPLHSTRRRSGRLFKKRRIAAPGGKY
ncbi:hypothetical protein FRACYDRAFT_262477 [Fragilariopsis cylindrus CCMP1102]|uniref:Uncharacterized protein n=1 Tax=Fragilariopsis cylindrus CCMP1102 TaxID=635003 RepID=A0A1E7F797_9STRA|nr:hypothetical protein FRACYDRAFT_262477 [Fragilariopsis cylindrus CCMP1102]|eukprot:OEU14030.1 hypothetical protein FRACYDRAFT_262477 [Fragilariopsis cylindrus CCMP1102]